MLLHRIPLKVRHTNWDDQSTYPSVGVIKQNQTIDDLLIHNKLYNINLHNVIHSLISRNPREQIFVVQISLLVVIFFSLISQNLSLVQTTKEVNPHPRIATCVNMWSVFFFFFFFHLLIVGACVRHITREDQVEWTTLV